MPVTTGRNSSRTVPAEVQRQLRAKFGEGCCVPGCSNTIFVQKGHIEPKAEGGSQEIENQVPVCTLHHTLFDAGTLWIRAWTEEGLPIFETETGDVLDPTRHGVPHRGTDPPPDRVGEGAFIGDGWVVHETGGG